MHALYMRLFILEQKMFQCYRMMIKFTDKNANKAVQTGCGKLKPSHLIDIESEHDICICHEISLYQYIENTS